MLFTSTGQTFSQTVRQKTDSQLPLAHTAPHLHGPHTSTALLSALQGHTGHGCYVRLGREEEEEVVEAGQTRWRDWHVVFAFPQMLWQGVMTWSKHRVWCRPWDFLLKCLSAGQCGALRERWPMWGCHSCTVCWGDTPMIWDVSQQRHSSGIFNCSEERCLITIIEHSGSLQTHLALLIRERNPLNTNSTSAARGKKAIFFLINKIRHLRISKRRNKRSVVQSETYLTVPAYWGEGEGRQTVNGRGGQ